MQAWPPLLLVSQPGRRCPKRREMAIWGHAKKGTGLVFLVRCSLKALKGKEQAGGLPYSAWIYALVTYGISKQQRRYHHVHTDGSGSRAGLP
ncbi:hypothetical protein JZ751_008034 [Albula glossodonta]|uniref:Uncharacterized protein n=1 Tax=Albula glossodonta TaxID=121402 RepID=A0A8T2P1K2_9TELE|nr:hypothetical protein JZ751_008034 [Albula glossodonta]